MRYTRTVAVGMMAVNALTYSTASSAVCDGKYLTDNLCAIIFHIMEYHKDGNFVSRDHVFGC